MTRILCSLWLHVSVHLCSCKSLRATPVVQILSRCRNIQTLDVPTLYGLKLHSSPVTIARKQAKRTIFTRRVNKTIARDIETMSGNNPVILSEVNIIEDVKTTDVKSAVQSDASALIESDKSAVNLDLKTSKLTAECGSDDSETKESHSKTTDEDSSKKDGDCEDKKGDGIEKLSRRAQRRLRRRQVLQTHKKDKKMKKRLAAEDAELIKQEFLNETDYYHHNGLRKVYPYHYKFATFAKGRWVGRSLLDVFMEEFRHDTSENYKKAIDEGRVKINGKQATADHILKDCDYVENTIHRHELPVTAEPINIVHEDEDVLVVNKPSSIPIHPCGRYRHNTMTFILAKQYGYHNLRGVYRLDRLTSGVLIFCKSQRRANAIQRHVKDRVVQKEYVCKVAGEFPSERVDCNMPLEVLSHKLGVFKACHGGKEAHTSFQRIGYNGKTSIVKCFPSTGRTHQIRIHLQYIGYPIVNDPIYNSSTWGPEIGKGGRYHKTEEQLIADLLEHHTVEKHIERHLPDAAAAEQVDDGTTVDMEGKQTSQVTSGANDERTGSLAESLTMEVVLDNQDSQRNRQNGVLSLLHKVDEREKADGLSGCGQEKVNEGTQSGVENLQCGSIAKHAVCKATSNSEDKDEVIDVQRTNCDMVNFSDEKSGEAPAKRPRMDSDAETSKTTSEKSSNTSSKSRPPVLEGFVPGKLTHDINCPQCRVVYRDPTPDQLQLYLHALSYKGPDWHYKTELPEWAKTCHDKELL